jgi:hypothetical protein
MDKQRHQDLIKRYIAFFGICFVLLLVGVVASVPMELTVNGAKLSFSSALIFSLILLALSVGMAVSSYQCWFQEKKTRENLEKYLDRLRSRSVFAHLPIYNQTTLLWYYRIITPIATIIFFCLFILVSLGSF